MAAITQFDLVDADAVGTTSGTLEDIGTVTTLAKTTDIMALWFNAVSTGVRTTGEATQGEFVVDPQGVLPQTLRVPNGYSEGGAPATNIQGYVSTGKLLPIMPSQGSTLGNASISSQFDMALEATTEMAAQFGVFYSVGQYEPTIMQNLGRVISHRVRNVVTATEPDLGNATSEQFPESLTINGNLYKKAVALGLTLAPDAILTAGEHQLGHVKFSGTLAGLDKQKYPLPAYGASLGTPVGSSLFAKELILPAYWELDGAVETIDPTGVIQTTTTGVFQSTVAAYLV